MVIIIQTIVEEIAYYELVNMGKKYSGQEVIPLEFTVNDVVKLFVGTLHGIIN